MNILPQIPREIDGPSEVHTGPASNPRAVDTVGAKRKEDHRYVYFKSTPYTFTQPSFRHGPIALSQDALREKTKMRDDDSDWVAFQMAILGGAGDLVEDEQDEEDIKQLEDITSWLGAFGFETYGALVGEDASEQVVDPVPQMRSSAPIPSTSTGSIVESSTDLSLPIGVEFCSGFWNTPKPNQEFNKAKFYKCKGLKRWVGEHRPKRPSFYRSTESPPPSPMMQLVVSMDNGEATVEDLVPMSYNLSHDLGDFLSWQAEQLIHI
ncbi:hypothetical protein ACHAO7_010072 [Fusarium culmorum]